MKSNEFLKWMKAFLKDKENLSQEEFDLLKEKLLDAKPEGEKIVLLKEKNKFGVKQITKLTVLKPNKTIFKSYPLKKKEIVC